MVKGFREFILRGSVVDLAIAVVIGTAFKAVVDALVKDILLPIVGALGVKGNFGAQSFSLNGSQIFWGDFLNVVVAFLLVAAAVYFVVVVPMNRIAERRAKPVPEASVRPCPYCLTGIPKAATKCSACTADVPSLA